MCGVAEVFLHHLHDDSQKGQYEKKTATPSLLKCVVVHYGKLVDVWPCYPCLYDARFKDVKNRSKRENAVAEMGQKLGESDLRWMDKLAHFL